MFGFRTSLQRVACGLLLIGVVAAATMLISSPAPPKVEAGPTAVKATPLDFDQTHYRRIDGRWQTVDDVGELPYV